MRLETTGAQIVQVLEHRGSTSLRRSSCKLPGFEYTWSSAAPVGRIVKVRLAGAAIDLAATYSVTCNNFFGPW